MEIIHFGSVPAMMEALAQLAATGHKVRPWADKPRMLSGFETDEKRLTIHLSALRAHYRIHRIEPYEDGIERYKADIKQVLNQSMPSHFEVGRQVVTRLVQKTTGRPLHHGRVVEIAGTDITIRHADDCCEDGILTTLDVDRAHAEWRQVIVRRSAWDRILGDD